MKHHIAYRGYEHCEVLDESSYNRRIVICCLGSSELGINSGSLEASEYWLDIDRTRVRRAGKLPQKARNGGRHSAMAESPGQQSQAY
jgi:hypothetical protein